MTTFLDMATINETAFFRELPQLDSLASEVLPRLLESRRDKDHAVLRVWSAACSNGAEVWTLAMLIDDFRLQSGGGWRFEIIGTDVSSEVLATAAEATYPARSLESVPQDLRRRYVLQSKNKELARICPALRERATFKRLNLMDPGYSIAAHLDLILLRNVLIYFDQATKDAILHKVTAHLRPGGVFCVGLAEHLRQPAELGLERIGASRFKKIEP
jgi:chemotaxis protein methyltransferase CheR